MRGICVCFCEWCSGTTSVTVLASEILREAEKLVTIQRVHPQTYVSNLSLTLSTRSFETELESLRWYSVIEGFRIASKAALGALEVAAEDNGCVLFSLSSSTLQEKEADEWLETESQERRYEIQGGFISDCTNYIILESTRSGQRLFRRTRSFSRLTSQGSFPPPLSPSQPLPRTEY